MPDEIEQSVVCAHCSAEISLDDTIIVDTEAYCHDCVVSCEECGTAFVEGDDELRDTYTTGYPNSFSRNRMSLRCSNCRWQCADCDRHFADGVDSGRNANDEQVCARCEENYRSCDDCGCTLCSDDGVYSETDDATYCSDCAKKHDESGPIYSYGYKPKIVKYYAPGEPRHTLLFGAEIEVGGSKNCDRGSDAEDVSSCGFWFCKEDSSIEDDGDCVENFEAVSHPASAEYWRNKDLSAFAELAKKGYRSYETTSCGMHVHASLGGISRRTRFRLIRFFRDHADLILKFSRRRRSALEEWAKVQCGNDKEFATHSRKKEHSNVRYVAINFTGHTAEFRIFRGTLNVAAIKRNIALVHSLIRFCETTKKGRLTYADYRAFLAGSRILEWLSAEECGSLQQWADKEVACPLDDASTKLETE